MTDFLRIEQSEGSFSCTFYCGELPVDDAVVAAAHTPNGYFWESLVQHLAPDLAEELELDSEAGMFAAYGNRDDVQRLQNLIDPYLTDGQRVAAAIQAAEAGGFRFDD